MDQTYIVLDPQKLKAARLQAKLSIEDVASQLSVSKAQIRHFESGYARPLADDLLTLCKIYKVSDWKELASEVTSPDVFHLRKKSNIVVQNA